MEVESSGYGDYLGAKGHNFVVYQEGELVQELPFHKIKRAVISSGNSVSSTALFWLAQYGARAMLRMTEDGKIIRAICEWNAKDSASIQEVLDRVPELH